MNEKQREWTQKHCRELRDFKNLNPNISDDMYRDVTGYVNVIISLARGNKEVQSAMFDVLEEFQRKYERNKKGEYDGKRL